MNNYKIPKSRQQRQFEETAKELIKAFSELQEEQQNILFEYALQLYRERNSRIYTDWRK